MSLQKDRKIMSLVDNWPNGMVATSPWLKEMGISRQLVQKYKKSGWISSVGRGAYKRNNEEVSLFGAIYALQNQLGISVHAGAVTALEHKGFGHYIKINQKKIFLFSDHQQKLPSWFRNYDWNQQPNHITTSFLPMDIGISEDKIEGFKLDISATERAILETLYLTPDQIDLVEIYMIAEGLQTLRPSLTQKLLENCQSIKVKRLFLYMADKAGLPVLKHLDVDKIDLGSGDRTIVPKGKYVSKYGLNLPQELVDYV